MKRRVMLVVLAMGLAASAPAAVFTVTNAADVNFGGTLRWAIG